MSTITLSGQFQIGNQRMKSKDYWEIRFELIERALRKKAELAASEINRYFKQAQSEIEKEILAWYARFAVNNQITMAQARRLLKADELSELHWDVREYIRHGEMLQLNSDWIKQLENASAKFHITRLESLKLQTQQILESLFGKQFSVAEKLLKRTYLDGYYHTAFEIQKGMSIGWDISAINEDELIKVLNRPWPSDGRTFSDRIWRSKTALVNDLHSQLTRNILLGRPPNESISFIADKFKTSKSNAERIILTESAYISSLAHKDCFKNLEVEQFEVLETLDGKTCKICGDMDGRVFDMVDFAPSVTAPPFHPRCRGCTVPHFDNNTGDRAARGADGGIYYVSSDMTYNTWEKAYVK